MTKKLRIDKTDLVTLACWELSDEQIDLFFKVMKNHSLILLNEAELIERVNVLYELDSPATDWYSLFKAILKDENL